MSFYFPWEAGMLLWLQDSVRNALLDPVMKTVTALGNHGLFWILLTLLLLIFPKTRKAGIASALALIFSLLINNMLLKNLVGRIRPYELIEGLELIVARAYDASFPSGHAGASMASAWALFRKLPRKLGIIWVVLALLIAFSRLYVGIHFPTDVLAGLLTGILCGELGVRVQEKISGLRNSRG